MSKIGASQCLQCLSDSSTQGYDVTAGTRLLGC